MVGDRYLQHILKWGAWFLMDPELFTRSLLGAGEIAVAAALSFTDFAPVPDVLARQLGEAAARETTDPWGARALAVDVLDRTIAHYAAMPADSFDPRLVRWLDGIRRIAEWNREPAESPPPQGGPDFGGVIEEAGGPSSEDSWGGSGVSLEEAPPDETSLFIGGGTSAPPLALPSIGAATASPMPR